MLRQCSRRLFATKRRVYITGGSSGIGLSLALRYARNGDDVILLARNQDKLDDAVGLCRVETLGDKQVIAGVSLDIAELNSLQVKMDAITREYGQPDLLILSAGSAGNKTFLDMNSEEFDSMMALNFSASREMARCVLPAMLQRDNGQIAFISSTAGLMGIYGYSAYCASKYAITGFVMALQQELYGTGVSAILVCPSEVATPMIAAESGSVLPQTRRLKDLGGTLSPEKAANIIFDGINKNKYLIKTGFVAHLFDFTHRVFPWLFRKITQITIWYSARN